MSTKFNKRSCSWNLFFKFFYYYAKVFGLIFFAVSKNGRPRSSVKAQMFSILCRLFCVVAFLLYYLPGDKGQHILTINQASIHVMSKLQSISAIASSLVCFVFQTIEQKKFVDIINRAIDIAYRVFENKKSFGINGRLCSFVILVRVCSNISLVVAEFLRLTDTETKFDVWEFVHYALRFYIWFGTLIVVDLICVGYVVTTGIYQQIGDQLKVLAKRVDTLDSRSLTKFRQMQMLCEFSEELENYAEIYSDLFKLMNEFHQLMQFYIFLMFCSDFLILIGNIHHTFLNYMDLGVVKWSILMISAFQAVQIVLYILLLNKTIKTSKLPNNLNFDLIVSDIEPRWDKSVDYFLNQLRFQDLNLNVYGLFQLNNELLLRGFSATASYLTILIQFQMLGYFK
ncbi:gustatory receptor for bitter taste 93a-like [Eupeodes corollae]|uniref:gustatory receptor for bitter taste 93a-like n=1 Tax=Eupeodes corollae TaxID=290404 RepID=UPI00248FF378|nr:gustatory receptor for bitter taste 93a-like [Eupeodes corollae]